jgi:hypothetical protein
MVHSHFKTRLSNNIIKAVEFMEKWTQQMAKVKKIEVIKDLSMLHTKLKSNKLKMEKLLWEI